MTTTQSTPLAIEATGLVKRFGSTTALDGVDLAARTGTVLGVLGPNGAGKTTAVRILATLLRPESGSARVAGLDVVRNAAAVRRQIGLTGQYASVDEDLTGTQNLVLIGSLLDLTRRQAKVRAGELLEWFDLSDAAERPAKTYSGGMRRRLDLAASLVGRPAVIYLDEPTTGLDPAKREEMWDVVRRLVGEGSTVLLTTQYLEEADALADEVSVIDHGRVIAHDTPQGLKRAVGGQRLTVRPADAADLSVVAPVLRGVADAGAEVVSPSRGVLSVPVASDDALTRAVAQLAARGVPLAELSLHLPSLDEVFFTLTSARSGAASTPVTATSSHSTTAAPAEPAHATLETSR